MSRFFTGGENESPNHLPHSDGSPDISQKRVLIGGEAAGGVNLKDFSSEERGWRFHPN